jgi:hypothetical protein
LAYAEEIASRAFNMKEDSICKDFTLKLRKVNDFVRMHIMDGMLDAKSRLNDKSDIRNNIESGIIISC